MSDAKFDVVFFGILQTGKDKDTVMQNMAKLFKTDAKKLSPYFAGGRKVIKGNISAEAAEKYKAALENAGLVIKIEESEVVEQAVVKAPSTATPNKETTTDSNGITVAPVGSDVIENPVEIPAQKIDDISDITMAEVGSDVFENPVDAATPQAIDDISDISMAEVGSNVLEHPEEVIAQEIEELTDVSLAETGSNMLENPEKVIAQEIEELTLNDAIEKE